MLLYLVYVCVLLFHLVKTDNNNSIWTDMINNTMTVTERCRNNCIVKCCPEGQLLAPTQNGTKCVEPKNKLIKQLINYNNIMVYRLGASSDLVSTNNSLQSHFTFIQNDYFSNDNNTVTIYWCTIYILEDGSLTTNEHDSCPDLADLRYCVEFLYTRTNGSGGVTLAYRAIVTNVTDAESKCSFIIAAILVSCFLVALVLVVYWLLPSLRTTPGLVLMAYMFSLAVAFSMKGALLVALCNHSFDSEGCRIFSPAMLFFTMARFFWLNVMSFDLWYTVRYIIIRRRPRAHCGQSQENNHKFIWYALYGWGTPALLTVLFVAIDRFHLYKHHNFKPPFDTCFANEIPTAIYMHVPIGVMTAANCVLFVMTAYNVWRIKRAIHNVKDANNTRSRGCGFIIYIKLSILMTGVSWVFELFPDTALIPYIFVNFYNMFIGVTIFCMFVCKKDVIIKLCERFNVNCRFINKS